VLASHPEPREGIDGVRALVARHHCRAGAELATAWRLPEPIIEACGHHHDDPGSASPLLRLVMMSDLLVGMLEVGPPVNMSSAQPLELASASVTPPKKNGAMSDPRIEIADVPKGDRRALLAPPSLAPDDKQSVKPSPAPLRVTEDEYERKVAEL